MHWIILNSLNMLLRITYIYIEISICARVYMCINSNQLCIWFGKMSAYNEKESTFF